MTTRGNFGQNLNKPSNCYPWLCARLLTSRFRRLIEETCRRSWWSRVWHHRIVELRNIGVSVLVECTNQERCEGFGRRKEQMYFEGGAETPEYKHLACLHLIPTANTVGILWNVSVDLIVVRL